MSEFESFVTRYRCHLAGEDRYKMKHPSRIRVPGPLRRSSALSNEEKKRNEIRVADMASRPYKVEESDFSFSSSYQSVKSVDNFHERHKRLDYYVCPKFNIGSAYCGEVALCRRG